MRVDRLSKSLLFLGFIVLVVGLYFYVSPYLTTNTTTDTFTVQALHYNVASTQLSKGDRVEGYFTVVGGNGDIDFRIKDPYGSVILDAGRVTGRRDFAFTAEFSGTYTYYFDNTFSLITSKTVFFSHNETIVAFPRDLTLVGALIGLMIVLLGISRVAQAYVKEKKQMANVPPPPPNNPPKPSST